MYNRYILPLDVVDDDLADLGLFVAVPEEEEVAALKGGFHGAGEDDDDGRGRVGDDGERFPKHEGGGEDEGEVEDLGEGLAWVGEVGRDGGEHIESCRGDVV